MSNAPSPTPADLAWCRDWFATMSDGGIWAVPRSGLIFTRRGDVLILTSRMPWTAELAQAVAADVGLDLPPSAGALADYQDADYELIRSRFKLAGIPVRSELEAGDG